MYPERPILRQPRAAKAGDRGARVAARPQPAARPDNYVSRETWRLVLAAHIQPLPDAAD